MTEHGDTLQLESVENNEVVKQDFRSFSKAIVEHKSEPEKGDGPTRQHR